MGQSRRADRAPMLPVFSDKQRFDDFLSTKTPTGGRYRGNEEKGKTGNDCPELTKKTAIQLNKRVSLRR
jgi:hypothetical protein